MYQNKLCLLIIIPMLAMITGCRVGPDYRPPCTEVEQNWSAPEELHDENHVINHADPLEMWQLFDDPQLAGYLQRIASENLDVRYAQQKVCEAYALRNISFAQLLPWIDDHFSYYTADPAGGTLSQGGTPSSNTSPLGGIPLNLRQQTFSAEFDALWEIDLFGGTRRKVESGTYYIGMECADYYDTIVSLTAEFARNYLELRRSQKLLSLIDSEIEVLQRKVDLTSQRVNRGLDNEQTLLQMQSDLDTLVAQASDVRAEILPYMYILSFLLGKSPETLVPELQQNAEIPEVIESVPVGFPSDLLRRRPDIRYAERQIAKATADVGVAVADLFPKLTLTGLYGFENLHLGKSKGQGPSWAYGGELLTPLFHGGAIRANIKKYQYIRSEALIDYEKAVLQALQESESAIARFLTSRESLDEKQKAFERSYQVLVHVRGLLRHGLDNELNQLTQEQLTLQSEQDLINKRVDSQIQLISLYKALGGSWG